MFLEKFEIQIYFFPTSFRRMKAVLTRRVLDVVDERGVRQDRTVFVDPVHGVFEGQLGRTVFVVVGK